MYIKELEAIGLTKSEILTYLALLKLGLSSTGAIVKEAGISSGKIYEILDKLIEKGLVSFSVKNNVKFFEASNPDKIKSYIEDQKQEFLEKERAIEKLIPNLKSFKTTSKKENKTLIYQGYEAIKTLLQETLNSENPEKQPWLGLSISLKSRSEQTNNMWRHFHKKRIKKKIPTKMIINDKNARSFFKEIKLCKVKLLENIETSSIAIYNNRILIFDWEDLTAVLIKNQNIAISFTKFFESLWKLAK